MEKFNLFHFSDPEWLYGLIAIPIILALYYFVQPKQNIKNKQLLEKFIDKHLLPHLLIKNKDKNQGSNVYSLILWSFIWCLLMLAMAGPRWSYREFEAFLPEQKMVILLDLSKSMDATDIQPSRMYRARLEIEEIIRLNSEISIGLVGFAAHAHMISPITRDHYNIKHILPLIGSDLVSVQGTRLLPALKMASDMLIPPGKSNNAALNSSIVILSDGGFQDSEAFKILQNLASQGIAIYTIGIGTDEGIRFVDDKGAPIIKNGRPVISKLDADRLKEISRLGNGSYFASHYSDRNALALHKILSSQNNQSFASQQTTKYWDEKFYIFLFPILLIIIFWFRRGFIFPFILAAIFLPTTSHAADNFSNLPARILLNDQNFAKKLVEEDGNSALALDYLEDPYRRGVAYYRSGDFANAAKEFKKNTRPEVQKESLYNLGNALAMQNQLKEAVDAYQKALEIDPNFTDAQQNMNFIKKMLEVDNVEDEKEKPLPEKKKDNDGKGGGGQDSQRGKKGDDNSPDNDNEEDANTDSDNNADNNEDQQDNADNQDQDSNANEDDDKQDDGQDANANQQSEKADNGENDQEQDANNSGGPENSNDNNQKNSANNAQNSEAQNNQQDSGSEGSSAQNVDIDEWLNRIADDHKNFLRNQFYLESRKQEEQEKLDNNIDPW